MTFWMPGHTAFQENGGPRVDLGGNGGISGCVNILGVEVCGQIGGGGTVPTGNPSGGDGGFTPLQDPGCPSGTVWNSVLATCVDIGAAFPGGDPLFQPPATNGCPNGGIPKVATQHMVTPILWKAQYGCQPAKGYRLNKSAYFRLDPSSGRIVRVGKEMAWVHGRRRNAANLRATDRAASRLKSAKDYASSLGRVQIKTKADWKAEKARRKKK